MQKWNHKKLLKTLGSCLGLSALLGSTALRAQILPIDPPAAPGPITSIQNPGTVIGSEWAPKSEQPRSTVVSLDALDSYFLLSIALDLSLLPENESAMLLRRVNSGRLNLAGLRAETRDRLSRLEEQKRLAALKTPQSFFVQRFRALRGNEAFITGDWGNGRQDTEKTESQQKLIKLVSHLQPRATSTPEEQIMNTQFLRVGYALRAIDEGENIPFSLKTLQAIYGVQRGSELFEEAQRSSFIRDRTSR